MLIRCVRYGTFTFQGRTRNRMELREGIEALDGYPKCAPTQRLLSIGAASHRSSAEWLLWNAIYIRANTNTPVNACTKLSTLTGCSCQSSLASKQASVTNEKAGVRYLRPWLDSPLRDGALRVAVRVPVYASQDPDLQGLFSSSNSVGQGHSTAIAISIILSAATLMDNSEFPGAFITEPVT